MEPRTSLHATGHPQRAGEVVPCTHRRRATTRLRLDMVRCGDQREELVYDGFPYYDRACDLQQVRLCRDNDAVEFVQVLVNRAI
jgi:hypothetical protein